ncbi:myogenesis-regulating glycosidase isoform X3 [Aethina tumida]|uniref:myogenesis-regulating glycosidase isoform X3 n=1 Tax=Aethina tumida TaxID=116153 RepID=UPI0021490451|nr:myogenesis-regulating glycosidase isoform X3 [Aethina tumida]
MSSNKLTETVKFIDNNDKNENSTETRTPLRNARRKSVTSPRMLRPPGDEESGSNSPAHSVTSNNSFASLLREKIQVVPEVWKKKSPDYKTRIFVGILFITIVVLIICAYFLYHQKILHKAYFEKIKLNNVKKVMRIYDDDGVEVIKVRLGTTLNYDKSLPCLPEHVKNDSSKCLEWMHNARLYINGYKYRNLKCYNIHWISLSKRTDPTDCFIMNGDHWYGGGQTAENAWPLEKGNHTFHPFITGTVDKHEWGNVLKRYFISSKGAVVMIDNESPLYVSVTEKELCLRAKYDDFAFANKFTPTAELNYSICASNNMSQLHSKFAESSRWDELRKEDNDFINKMIAEPLWEVTTATKEELTVDTLNAFSIAITNITEKISKSEEGNILKLGHILINEFWQKHIGDFELDETRFPSPEETVEKLHRRGFGIVFSIQPYISTESSNFAEAVERGLLVSERFSDRRIPALTRYKTLQSAGVLDVTNNRSVTWISKKLKNITEKYKIKLFNLDVGTAYNMPHYYQCEKLLLNPDQYKTLFVKSLQNEISIFGVNSAIERPPPPTFVFLPPFESSWEGLRRVIPTILTYGILGFPFIIPGAVGGDFKPTQKLKHSNGTEEEVLDEELYIRWLQLSTFLPVLRFNKIPSGSKKFLDLDIQWAAFRHKEVSPVLKRFSNDAIVYGYPIIRPLWMLDSNDPACHTVTDEFSIGDNLIVAPILHAGAREREIYLPAGVWRDGIDESLKRGSRWIHDYKVDEGKIAYFVKITDKMQGFRM